MTKDNTPGLLSRLSNFGLKDLTNIEIYSSSREKENQQKNTRDKDPKIDIENMVFDRKVKCPVCESELLVKSVKSSSVRIISRDTDFMVHYKEPNPLFYDVWLCTHCGYAAPFNKFPTILDSQKKLIREHITSKWNFNRTYPSIYDADIAIEMHELALLNTIVKKAKDSEKAALCLRLGWLYRIKKDEHNEQKFLNEALQGLLHAFEVESNPIMGLDEHSVQYLIGELYRRIGNTSEALSWLGKVVVNRDAKPRLKDMARTQKDLILHK